jgi:hypothetical protein
MHDFFTAHFGLLNEYTNIQLSSILGFTAGYLLFSDVQQYALNEGYGLSAESQDAINIATTLWDLLTEAERQEWHDLARELAPIYEELNRMSAVPLISTVQHIWIHAELRNIWSRLFRAYHVREMAFQMMLVSYQLLINIRPSWHCRMNRCSSPPTRIKN